MTTPTTQPYAVQGFHITGLKQHETEDGVAYVCLLREHGKKIGNAEQAGQGGSTDIYFDDRAAEGRFQAASEAYNAQQPEPREFSLLDALLEHLIYGYELDRAAKKNTACLTSLRDEFGHFKEMWFKAALRPEQWAQITKRYPECTHVWVIGVGWTPLT